MGLLAAPSRAFTPAAIELVQGIVGRTLRRAEQAIDVLRLDQALERAKDDLETAIRAEMLAATIAWKFGGAIRPALSVTDRMRSVLDRLTEIGRQEALLELERLGYSGIRDLESNSNSRAFVARPGPQPGQTSASYLTTELPHVQTRIVVELVNVDLSAASQTAVAQALLRVPGARDIASRVISTALIDGIGMTFEDNADLIRCWEYTAVLDAGTCSRCAPLDGKRYDSLQALFHDLPNFGPNPHCKGGGRCRCRAVPCHVDDVGQNEPALTGAELAQLPAWRGEIEAIKGRTRGELQVLDLPPGPARAVASASPEATAFRERMLTQNAAREFVPSAGMQQVERETLRAGELVDDEIRNQLGTQLEELRATSTLANRELAELRAGEYASVSERLSAIQRELAQTNDALRTRFVAEIQAAEPELSGFNVYEKARAKMAAHPDHLRLRAAIDEVKAEQAKIFVRLNEIRGRVKIAEQAEQELLRKTTLEVLGEIREMGPGGEQAWKYTTGGLRGKAKERLESAGDLYPAEWIERGRANPLKPTFRENGRGYHQGGMSQSEIVISGGDRSKIAGDPSGFATAIHELGHHMEHVDPRIKLLEWAFYQRRVRPGGLNAAMELERRFPRGLGYGAHETYREDGFTEKYMGKAYTGAGAASHYELVSMGIEALWTGSYEMDLEMRRFILGLLATL